MAGVPTPPKKGRFGLSPGIEMTVDAVVSDVRLATDEPLREGNVRPIEDFGPGRKPVEALRLLCPEPFRIFRRRGVESIVFRHGADECTLAEILRRREELL